MVKLSGIICTIYLSFFGCKPTPNHSATCVLHGGTLFFHNSPLSVVLAEMAVHDRIIICNPMHLEGVPMTAIIDTADSVTKQLVLVKAVEQGVVFLCYQDHILYVGDRPFPDRFDPRKSDWPCGKHTE